MFFFAKNHFPTQNLLSDAKVLEYELEGIVSSYFPHDITEVINALANILSKEVATNTPLHAQLYPLNGVKRMSKSLVMTDVGNYYISLSNLG